MSAYDVYEAYDKAMKSIYELALRRPPMTMENLGKHFPGPEAEAKPESDNWIHRSVGMQCHTCMWYVKKSGGKGRCRRHAPTLGGWPVMFDSDWCGDHKLS